MPKFESENSMTDHIAHSLKSWPQYFRSLKNGRRRFDVRFNDRDFQAGDKVCFQEWNPEIGQSTGQEFDTWIWGVYHDVPGLQEGYVVLALG